MKVIFDSTYAFKKTWMCRMVLTCFGSHVPV